MEQGEYHILLRHMFCTALRLPLNNCAPWSLPCMCVHLQMESTLSIQALKPRMDELKAKYENEPETLQLETARLYKAAGINPLAGCLPTLATIPVFIGLYRCV